MRTFERKTKEPDHTIRPYEQRDREVVRRICCETGFLGEPIDAVFSDREVFADFLTRYYTDIEPESSWVGEKNGQVVGYLLGCKRWHLNRWWNLWNQIGLAFKVGWRLLTGHYDAKSRKFLKWIVTRGWRETPAAPSQSAHFHCNSLKGHRKIGIIRDLIMTLFEDLRKHGVPKVYGQMVTYDSRRTERVFEYMGFKVVSKKRISKYEKTVDKELYLTTAVMEINETREKKSIIYDLPMG